MESIFDLWQTKTVKILWAELKKYKGLLTGALVLATVNTFFSLLDPLIFQLIVDRYATKINLLSTQDFVSGVGLLLAGTILVAFISRTAKAFQDYYVNVITQRVGNQMYAKSVAHAFSLPYAVFEDERSGEVLSKLQKARLDSQALITHSVNILFLSSIGMIFVVSYALYVNVLIGLVYFSIIPTLGIAIFFISKKIKEAQQKIVKETASLSGSTTETLRNVELVKSLGLDEQEIARLNKTNDGILGLELKKVKLVRTLDFIQGTIINALRTSLMFLMLWLIFKGGITLGEFFSLLFYSFAIFAPLGQMGLVATSYQEASASLAQLDELYKMKPMPKPAIEKPLDEIKKIEYRGVSLAYHLDGKDVLREVSLSVSSGETIALVGPSGSGKSTMIKLLTGLYSPTAGSIFFNDISIGELDVDGLRRRVGLVAQETQLFAGTIRENLLFVKPTATDEECLEALDLAQVKDIINREESGLDTKIGEGGIKLSGGERQRLAIARALLRNPDLIVFDEATSSLDSITERAISDTIRNIEKTRPNIITILVAHRLSTIAHADRIYVFEKGKIIESGNHTDLVKNGGLYSALWREQSAVS